MNVETSDYIPQLGFCRQCLFCDFIGYRDPSSIAPFSSVTTISSRRVMCHSFIWNDFDITIAFRWTMYATLSGSISCMIGATAVTTWSDKIGRKKAIAFPVIGSLVAATSQFFIILYG